MKDAAQAWFMGGPITEEQQSSSSLLADWNSYAASREFEESSSGLGFDLEAAVKTANDKVTGTFSVVSKGVRDLPGSFQSATSNVPTGKSLMYFGLFLATGVFFVFIAFTMFLPVMVLMPQKFAICFTLGCAFIIGSFFALKEASIYSGIHWQYGWYDLCINGPSQLHSVCVILRVTGTCTLILCTFLLPRRIGWTEVPYFHSYLFNIKMFWQSAYSDIVLRKYT
ncbi:Vesicle transport protein [Macleaya cordata]|uniref:Vesicle transport protein n=1 Tax=Macleaya cordata TaxID=56857 RepID=A0A200RAM9_MACCD|nr:Vesicle transport protein [Macleaya cordata]